MNQQPVWIDIENPPQVQYLVPFVAAFHRAGRNVVLTARDAGITVDLLRDRDLRPRVVGGQPPAGRARKLLAVARRAARLEMGLRRTKPAAVICSSRAATVVARGMGIPCFVMCDYEHAELNIYRRLGATLLYPDVIPTAHFRSLGFGRERLIAFRGLKEDISFAEVDLDSVRAHDLGPTSSGTVKVLVRPPAESSHYFDPRSRASVAALLEHLSGREDVLTVFSPRHPDQIRAVNSRSWRRAPIVIREAVPFVALLKAVDRVVSAGATMLREAAYMGIPAFSLFSGELGAVDGYLERSGRLTVLGSPGEFAQITDQAHVPAPFPRNSALVDELASAVLRSADGCNGPR